jgi:hypothetical protein
MRRRAERLGQIPEWEYPIRVGAPVAEGKQLLREIEDPIGERKT